MGRPPRDIPVQAAAFGDHPLVIIAGPDHHLAKRRDIAKEVVAREHFMVRKMGSGTQQSFEYFLSDIPARRAGMEMDSNATMKQAVMASARVHLRPHGRLVLLDVVGLPIRREWFSVVRTDRVVMPVIASFKNFMNVRWARFLPVLSKLYPASASS